MPLLFRAYRSLPGLFKGNVTLEIIAFGLYAEDLQRLSSDDEELISREMDFSGTVFPLPFRMSTLKERNMFHGRITNYHSIAKVEDLR